MVVLLLGLVRITPIRLSYNATVRWYSTKRVYRWGEDLVLDFEHFVLTNPCCLYT
jgi:hypothetical protein